jgi:hypothetical protein
MISRSEFEERSFALNTVTALNHLAVPRSTGPEWGRDSRVGVAVADCRRSSNNHFDTGLCLPWLVTYQIPSLLASTLPRPKDQHALK